MRRITTYIAGLLFLTALTGCIKEDRVDCPCWLDIFVSECESISRDVTISAYNHGRIFTEKIDVRDYPQFYEHTVGKGLVNVTAYAGRVYQTEHEDTLQIRRGYQCDSLFTRHADVECYYEFAYDTLRLHKQFSTVFLKMENPAGGKYPFRLVVKGNVNGIRLTDSEPTLGIFEHELTEREDGTFRFRIPRQIDNSLVMEVYEDDVLIETLPFGEAIAQHMKDDGSFTWHSLDLGDIYIGVDYARTIVSVAVNAWTQGDSFQVII